jgi:outer membrane murein-binding lipoprotein Lpp
LSQKPPTHELCFYAGLYKLAETNGKKQAVFYLMNTTRNRRKPSWGVTEQALDEALPTLLGKPLGMGAGYKTDQHYPQDQLMDSGTFTSHTNHGRYALGTAEITDTQTYQMLKTGQLKAISTVIYPYYEFCSTCNEQLDANWEEHPHIKTGEGYARVESFEFARFDFIDTPAYPQAGFLNFASNKQTPSDNTYASLPLLAGLYACAQPNNQATNPKKVNKMDEKDIVANLASLQTNVKDLTASVAALTTTVNTMRTEAQAEKAAQTQKETTELIEAVYQARLKAGLTTEAARPIEITKLTACNTEALKLLIAEANTKPPTETKEAQTKHPKQQELPTNLEAALEAASQTLGFKSTAQPNKEEHA